MTLEELLECPPDELRALDEVALEAHFGPMLDVTRPERVATKTPTKSYPSNTSPTSNVSAEKKAKMQRLAAEAGIDDLDDLFD